MRKNSPTHVNIKLSDVSMKKMKGKLKRKTYICIHRGHQNIEEMKTLGKN